MKRKRIALFGGSFNPIHNGHIGLARQVLAEGFADEVWLLVSPQNPLKAQADLLDEKERLEIARAALANAPHILASDFEFHLPRPSYTWNTLHALHKQFPDHDFILLIGADNWANFHRWYRADDIIRTHQLIVYPRQGYPLRQPEAFPKTVQLLQAPLFPYSSTDIRHAVAESKDISAMVPPEIRERVIKAYSVPHT